MRLVDQTVYFFFVETIRSIDDRIDGALKLVEVVEMNITDFAFCNTETINFIPLDGRSRMSA